jgi:hypothetical protein
LEVQSSNVPKILKKIGGWILAIWGAIRAPVDFLESVKATHHYAEYLYSHSYLALTLVPKSAWFTAGLLIAGIALIFSGQISSFVRDRWPRLPNIKGNQILNCAVLWDETKGCYVRQAAPPQSVFGILLEIANQVEQGKPSPTAGRVKAQTIFHFKNGQTLLASPSAWIDEPASSVELAPGDTRCLIIATGFHFTQDWRVPLNRRSNITSPVSFEHWEIPGLLGNNGTADVQLISLDTNKIITSFILGWQWKPQYPLTITGFSQVKH